jgi:hypothetical protein
MSVLKAYKFLVTVPSTSRLFSISHTRTSSTPEDGKRWETQEDRRQFKIQTDFEYRKRRHEQRAVYNRKWYARPENHARHRAKQREARANRRVRSPYLGPMSYAWAQWLRRYAWVRDELDWRSHVPVYSPVRIERNCERCNFPSSTGAMLWWVSTRMNTASQQDDSTSVSERQDRLVALQGSI